MMTEDNAKSVYNGWFSCPLLSRLGKSCAWQATGRGWRGSSIKRIVLPDCSSGVAIPADVTASDKYHDEISEISVQQQLRQIRDNMPGKGMRTGSNMKRSIKKHRHLSRLPAAARQPRFIISDAFRQPWFIVQYLHRWLSITSTYA